MSTRLAQIVAASRRRIFEARQTADLSQLEKRAEDHLPRGFRRALEAGYSHGVAIIAELKKASPSRGLIRANFDPVGSGAELAGCGCGGVVGADRRRVLSRIAGKSAARLRRTELALPAQGFHRRRISVAGSACQSRRRDPADCGSAVADGIGCADDEEPALRSWMFCAKPTTKTNCSGPWMRAP